MPPERVVQTVEPAGLTPIKVVEIPPYHYAALFEKQSD